MFSKSKCISLLMVLLFVTTACCSPFVIKAAPTTDTTTTSSTTTTTSLNTQVGCNLSKSSDLEKQLLARVNMIQGQKFEWSDEDHKYYFAVCGTADHADANDVGFLQINTKGVKFVLGRLNDVDLEGASNVIRMVYKNGDRYNSACEKAERTSVVYLVCDKTTTSFKMIEENNERDKSSCDYIFELKTHIACDSDVPTTVAPAPTTSSSTTTTVSSTTTISTGTPASTTTTTSSKSSSDTTKSSNAPTSSAVPNSSSSASPSTTPSNDQKRKSRLGPIPIILIVLSSLLFSYVIFGTMYLRVVKRARGVEQIPNWQLWSAAGSRIADGFNYVVRCGKRPSEVHSYENINDRLSDDDENLLNM